MRIVVSLIVMAMITATAYAADTVASKSASASVSPKSASSAAQPPKGLKGDPSATKGKLTTPPADEAPKAPASGSIPPLRLPK